MKKKLLGILICTLMISTAALSVAVSADEKSGNLGGWSQKQILLASDGVANDRFGSAV